MVEQTIDSEQKRLQEDTEAHNKFFDGTISPMIAKAQILESAAENTPFLDQRILLKDEAEKLYNHAAVQSEISHAQTDALFKDAWEDIPVDQEIKLPIYVGVGLGALAMLAGAAVLDLGADQAFAKNLPAIHKPMKVNKPVKITEEKSPAGVTMPVIQPQPLPKITQVQYPGLITGTALTPEAITRVVAPEAVTAQTAYLKLINGRRGTIIEPGFRIGIDKAELDKIGIIADFDIFAREYFRVPIEQGIMAKNATATTLPSKDLKLDKIIKAIGAEYPTQATAAGINKLQGELKFKRGEAPFRIRPQYLSRNFLEKLDDLMKVGSSDLTAEERKAIGLLKEETLANILMNRFEESGVRVGAMAYFNRQTERISVPDLTGTPMVNKFRNYDNGARFSIQAEPRFSINDIWALHALFGMNYAFSNGKAAGASLDVDELNLEAGLGGQYTLGKQKIMLEAGYEGRSLNLDAGDDLASVTKEDSQKGFFARVLWAGSLDSVLSAAYKRTEGSMDTTTEVTGMPTMNDNQDTEKSVLSLTGEFLPVSLGKAGKIGILAGVEKVTKREGGFQTDENAVEGQIIYRLKPGELRIGAQAMSVDTHQQGVDIRNPYKFYILLGAELGSSKYRGL